MSSDLHASMSTTADGGDTLIQGHLLVNRNLIARDLVLPHQQSIKFAPAKSSATTGAEYTGTENYSITADASSLRFRDTDKGDILVFQTSTPVAESEQKGRMLIKYARLDGELEVSEGSGIRFRDTKSVDGSSAPNGYFEVGLGDSGSDASKNELYIKHSQSQEIVEIMLGSDLIGTNSADKRGMYPHNLGALPEGKDSWLVEDLGDYKAEVLARYKAAHGGADLDEKSVYTGALYKAWPSTDGRTWQVGDFHYTDRQPVISIRDDEVRLGVNLFIDGTLTVTEGTQASFGDVANFSKDVGMDGALTVVGRVRANNDLYLSNPTATHTVLSGFNVTKALRTTSAEGDLIIFDKFIVDAETGVTTAKGAVVAENTLTVQGITTLNDEVRLEQGARVLVDQSLSFTSGDFSNSANLFNLKAYHDTGGVARWSFDNGITSQPILQLASSDSTFSSDVEIRSADSKLSLGSGGSDAITLNGKESTLSLMNVEGVHRSVILDGKNSIIATQHGAGGFLVNGANMTVDGKSTMRGDLMVGMSYNERHIEPVNRIFLDGRETVVGAKNELVLATYGADYHAPVYNIHNGLPTPSPGVGNALLLSEFGDVGVMARKRVTLKSHEGIVLENTDPDKTGLTIKTAGDVTFEGAGKLAFAVKVMTLDGSAGNPYFLTPARVKQLADAGEEGRMYVDENGIVRVIRKETESLLQYQGVAEPVPETPSLASQEPSSYTFTPGGNRLTELYLVENSTSIDVLLANNAIEYNPPPYSDFVWAPGNTFGNTAGQLLTGAQTVTEIETLLNNAQIQFQPTDSDFDYVWIENYMNFVQGSRVTENDMLAASSNLTNLVADNKIAYEPGGSPPVPGAGGDGGDGGMPPGDGGMP